ncbi:MAG: 16S rRNA (guanine(527)-N(7))-methyltransferase RsmG [Solirubrobacteraceae bacterium]
MLGVLTEDPLAPTTIDAAHAVDDHLADSLVALELEEVRAATTIADLGSGAGLPGLPLAITLPTATVHLVESSTRKCEFLRRAVRTCDLANAEVVHARIEEWRASVDLVTARALAPLEVVIEYAAPLLRIGGTLVAWRGHRDPEAEAAAAKAAEILGIDVGEIRPVRPYPEARNRHLHLMSKVMETPSGFPRRPGIAMKRPLGSAQA